MKVLSLLTAASAASAHTIFVALEAGGTTNPVGHGVRAAKLDSPIQNVASNDMACNGASNSVMSTDKIINVEAGSTVKAVWRHTLQSGPNDVMDASHKGPTIAYLKKVDNALTDSGLGGGWFKIQEDGHNNGQWGTSTVISNGGLHSITIPKCLPNGQYLLRAEMIALHGAGSSGGAQLYVRPHPTLKFLPKLTPPPRWNAPKSTSPAAPAPPSPPRRSASPAPTRPTTPAC